MSGPGIELFIEVQCEEIPARFVAPAMEGFAAGIQKLLGSLVLGPVRPYSTPRRLAIAVQVAASRPAIEKVVTGMPLAQARSAEGLWGPAALGFAKKRGVDASALFDHNGFAAIRVVEGGESTATLIAAGLEAVVIGIPFKKTMRWGESATRFARPIHGVLCVLDGQVVPATVVGLACSNVSTGHWLLSPEPFAVTHAEGWLNTLRERGVYADRNERHVRVEAQLRTAAAAEGLHVQPDADLLDEVVNLVESPKVIVGHFNEELLNLPHRLLIESMKVNQRYFPLFSREGARPLLTNAFLIVANNPEGDAALIAEGNARVLGARFHDAQFFYAADRKVSLGKHAEKLAGTVWIRGLGTMAERQEAITAAAEKLAQLTGANADNLRRLGTVLKADLATLMVGEFPELQGHVGHLLAASEGYADALAIEEAWLPRHSGDALPSTSAGLCFALAERMTLLSRCFVAEMEPKGSDPQGLRRAAVGLVALLQALPHGAHGGLDALFAAANVPLPKSLADFLLARLRASLTGEGHATDLVDAVMATGGADIASITARVHGLSALPKDEMAAVRITFRRVAGLGRDHSSSTYSLGLLQSEADQQLHMAVQALPTDDADLLVALRNLRPVVDRFFAEVMVMCDDLPLRENRLGLLRGILDRFSGFADFARLSGE